MIWDDSYVIFIIEHVKEEDIINFFCPLEGIGSIRTRSSVTALKTSDGCTATTVQTEVPKCVLFSFKSLLVHVYEKLM
jgi:hypothetical protein